MCVFAVFNCMVSLFKIANFSTRHQVKLKEPDGHIIQGNKTSRMSKKLAKK